MSLEQDLLNRSNHCCELCTASTDLRVFCLPPDTNSTIENSIVICKTCNQGITTPNTTNTKHWRCLNDSMWSTIPAVQVMAWRLLTTISKEVWPQDLLDMLYLDDETLTWAKAGQPKEEDIEQPTLDCNGGQLHAGDTVTLVKDLNVKGANFTAKRGTAVRGISLTTNPEQIEGRVNGIRIVLLTKFLKKSH